MTSRRELTTVLDTFKPGDTVTLTIVRYNNVQTYTNNNYDSYFSSPFGYGFPFGSYGFSYGYGYGNNGNGNNGNGNDGNNGNNGNNGNTYSYYSGDVSVGGGRGIRNVDSPDDLEAAIIAAKTEALSFFGNDGVYLEKFIVNPRHIEIQILADSYGNVVHLGERDCSMQRRNQKMIEETPSPAVDFELRKRMGEAAVAAAKGCGYQNAGTVEFLLDDDKNFYFMEMNARIQVEHGITELVTGIDIVKNQIMIAQGCPLNFTQDDVIFRGHAIECRVNAEKPDFGFAPSPGTINSLFMPCGAGVRVDSAIYNGYTIPPYYDSMIAKVMAYAPNRKEAIQKMKWALAEFLVDGIDTNIDFQLSLLREKEFEEGNIDIGYLQRKGF